MRPYREQFVRAAEKLASQLIHAIEALRLIEGFVEKYAAEYDRAGLTTHPVRHREMVATLGREVLLAMGARMAAELPRRLGGRRKSVAALQQAEAAEAFCEALVAALHEQLDWSVAEKKSFAADLHLYTCLTRPVPRPSAGHKTTRTAQGPFADRCALLLDPAMLEQARRAAGEFLLEIERITDKTVARVFRRGRQSERTGRRK